MPLHDLTNKVVLLTGIGCVGEGWGNGTTIATLFARQGAIIYGCDINLDAAKRAAEQIRKDPEVQGRKGDCDVMPVSTVGAARFCARVANRSSD